jgi:hypothetical protein
MTALVVAQFALQSAAVHVQDARCNGDVVVVFVQYALDMFQFQSLYIAGCASGDYCTSNFIRE